jgi:integrase
LRGEIIELVQPIKDKERIEDLKRELKIRNYKYYIFATIALNTGMRGGDIVPLKVKDVKRKSHIYLREQKTKKLQYFPINTQLRGELDHYVIGKDDEDYLFPSRQKNSQGIKTHITRVQAYRFIKAVAVDLGIEEFGLHSFRKSFGYFFYKKTKDIVQLMQIFNHSSQKITKRYIGITQEEIDESLEDFFI